MTDRESICGTLARLASRATQRAYVSHADEGEYPMRWFVDMGHHCVRRVRTSLDTRSSLPAAAVQAVFDLEPLLDAATDEHLTDDDPRLDAVRQQAERCLAALGINLVEWEKMHGLTHAD